MSNSVNSITVFHGPNFSGKMCIIYGNGHGE